MRAFVASLASVALVVAGFSFASPAFGKATQAELYLDGVIVGTTANPGSVPSGTGTDPIYNVTNGVEDQLGIAGVGPGDSGYHGGRWAVYLVTFGDGVEPYLLTSDEAVYEAEEAGDVAIERAPDLDNRCPITNKK